MRLWLAVIFFVPLAAVAESAYVTDTLRLGLHKAEDTSDRPFRNLESGQQLEVLNRSTYYAYVQLPDGTQGHVKASYLVSEKPAKLVVAEITAERDRYAKELQEAKQAFAAPAATIDTLRQQGADLQVRLDDSEAKAAELADENEGLRQRVSRTRRTMPLNWVAGAVALCAIAGFLLGLRWMDYRSRKRHGGIRIY